MRRTPPSLAPSIEHSAYARGYEVLRRHALSPGPLHHRHGLAMLARRGVAAWLHVFAELPVSPCGGRRQGPPPSLPGAVDRPVIDILLAMLKGHMGKEMA